MLRDSHINSTLLPSLTLKLEKFRVESFRCLEHVDWIPLKKLTIFTGQNNAGKTSALEILSKFLNPKGLPEEDDYTIKDELGPSAQEMVVEGVFLLNESEKQELGLQDHTIQMRRTFKKNEVKLRPLHVQSIGPCRCQTPERSHAS